MLHVVQVHTNDSKVNDYVQFGVVGKRKDDVCRVDRLYKTNLQFYVTLIWSRYFDCCFVA